jgi:hypothetical protein
VNTTRPVTAVVPTIGLFCAKHVRAGDRVRRRPAMTAEAETAAAVSPACDLVNRVVLLRRVIYLVVADERFPKARLVPHEDLSRDPVQRYAQLYDARGLTFTDTVAKAWRHRAAARIWPRRRREAARDADRRQGETRELEAQAGRRGGWAESRWVTEETAAFYYPDLVLP